MTTDGAGAAWMLFPRARWRSRRELERWIARHRARLVRLARSWSGDSLLAEDLVQEAFSRAIRAAPSLRDEARVDAWMFRILHRVYLDHLKSAGRREHPTDTTAMDAMAPVPIGRDDDPQSAASVGECVEAVRRAVMSLPAPQRQVIALVDLEEFTYGECARVLDIPVGTVMSRLSRARATLRAALQDSSGHRLRRVK